MKKESFSKKFRDKVYDLRSLVFAKCGSSMIGFTECVISFFFFQDISRWEFFYGLFFLVLYFILSMQNMSFPNQGMNGVKKKWNQLCK